MPNVEEMRAFFAARVDGYDEHMLREVGSHKSYAKLASLLPEGTQALLDLGCGTGLELEGVFARFPGARVTGIDMTQAMLDALARKYPGRHLTLLCGDYLKADFGEARYDAALSAETLHHLTPSDKLVLYRRVRAALRHGGRYVEMDYVADSQADEDTGFARRRALLEAESLAEGHFHVDTPLTVPNQLRLLREAGFSSVSFIERVGNSATFVAE